LNEKRKSTWAPEEDLQLIEQCVNEFGNISNLQMSNRVLWVMIIRLIVLKESYGFEYKNILENCKNNVLKKNNIKWNSNSDQSSRSGQKWIKSEDDFIKECHDKNLDVEQMIQMMGLKGRSLVATKLRYQALKKNNWDLGYKESEFVNAGADHTSKLNARWTNSEIEELKRQRFVAKREVKNLVIEGKTEQSIRNKLRRIKHPTTDDLLCLDESRIWTSLSTEKLKKMFKERKDWTDAETRLELGRSIKSCKKHFHIINEGKIYFDEKIIKSIESKEHLVKFLKVGKNMSVNYLGAFTTTCYENGLLRVNEKIKLYKLINKPSVDLNIVYDENRLVISFEKIENSIHTTSVIHNLKF
jgi:hypothetical protein